MIKLGNKYLVPLTKGYRAIIDKADSDLISKYKWRVSISHAKNNRPWICAITCMRINGIKKNISMHKLLMGSTGIDHIDRNPLNNSRSNLRKANRSQQGANRDTSSMEKSSKYRGVHYCRRERKWISQIMVYKKKIRLGCFVDEHEAAKSYNKSATKYFGRFAFLNKIKRTEGK